MFDPHKLYATDDPALLTLGKPSTLASWRHLGQGPDFIKSGARVVYSGAALNDWLVSRTVHTKGGPALPSRPEAQPAA